MSGPAGQDYFPIDDKSPEPRENEVVSMLALALAMGAGVYVHATKTPKVQAAKDKLDLFNATIAHASSRLLPGAHLVRSGRPMTDIMKKIKKHQRRVLKGAMLSYRMKNKSTIRALTNQNRKSARSAYKH